MKPALPSSSPALLDTLMEYAAFDASLLFGDFMRRALLFVYADTDVLAYKAHAQRSLAFRLLARSDALGRRFLRLRLEAIRQAPPGCTDTSDPSAPASPEVLSLTRALRQACREDATAILHLLRQEQPSFGLEHGLLNAEQVARDLEDCLSVLPLSGVERGIVFHAWAGVFCATMQSTCEKYRRVLTQQIAQENPSRKSDS